MPDILAMLTHERDKLNRAIEALGDTVVTGPSFCTKRCERVLIPQSEPVN
jgi:hypothetical protein